MGYGSIVCGSVACGSVAYGYIGCGYTGCGSGVAVSEGPVGVPLGNKIIVWTLNGYYSWNKVIQTVGSCDTL